MWVVQQFCFLSVFVSVYFVDGMFLFLKDSLLFFVVWQCIGGVLGLLFLLRIFINCSMFGGVGVNLKLNWVGYCLDISVVCDGVYVLKVEWLLWKKVLFLVMELIWGVGIVLLVILLLMVRLFQFRLFVRISMMFGGCLLLFCQDFFCYVIFWCGLIFMVI